MNGVQFISNQNHDNHLKTLLKCFEKADEVWMATAFLKVSGLKLLLPSILKHVKANKPIHIIAGQNFGLTEPDTLSELHNLFSSSINANLYLDKAKVQTKVFHPKLFIFRSTNNVNVISGSANITKGGLSDNQEFSINFRTFVSNPEFLELNEYFKNITSIENAEVVTLAAINRYKQYFNEQKNARKNQKIIPDKSSDDYGFDYTKLLLRLKTYDRKEFDFESKWRIKDYIEAKKLLDEIVVSTRLTQKRFEEILDTLVGKAGQKGLWRSGSLLRLRFGVYNSKPEFKALVKFIKDNQFKDAGKVFSNAKEYVKKIDGARMNYVAEIMMTYQPKRFANLNSNPIKVLKEQAGVYFKAHSDSYNANDYQEYCAIVQEICIKLGLKNMLEADSFINKVYWELKQEETT